MTMTGGKARWLVGGAFISLCLNLFLIGVIAGWCLPGRGPLGMLMHGKDWEIGHMWGQSGFGPMDGGVGMGGLMGGWHDRGMSMMPGEARTAMHEALAAHKKDFEAAHKDLWTARKDAATALAAEPFDAAAFQAALARMEAPVAHMQALMHESMLAAAKAMPVEARKRWADRWQDDR